MSGHCYNQEGAVVVNGPIASPCYVVQSESVLDGYGTPRITFGQRSTLSTKRGGSMLMPVKRRGIIRGYTLKVSLVHQYYHGRLSDGIRLG